VLHRGELRDPLTIPLGVAVLAQSLAERLLSVMDGHEAVEELLEGRGEPLVGRLCVGEHRVTTPLGHRQGIEDGAHGWGLHEGDVGVPPVEARLLQRVATAGVGVADF
jgi:hypothetical protein